MIAGLAYLLKYIEFINRDAGTISQFVSLGVSFFHLTCPQFNVSRQETSSIMGVLVTELHSQVVGIINRCSNKGISCLDIVRSIDSRSTHCVVGDGGLVTQRGREVCDKRLVFCEGKRIGSVWCLVLQLFGECKERFGPQPLKRHLIDH